MYKIRRTMDITSRVIRSDLIRLAKFLAPLAFTEIAIDIGEQFLNRSLSKSAEVVEVLAGFGLAYVLVKIFVGILAESKQAGLVLVHDRNGFFKILACFIALGLSVMATLLVVAWTQLGEWLIADLHGVGPEVTRLARLSLALFSAYPLIDTIAWYHGGILMQRHHSVIVGVASLADIIAQIFTVAVLVYTPILCDSHVAVAVPITAAYCGVLTRCFINIASVYRLVFKSLSKTVTTPVSLWKLFTFISPLMLVMLVQRLSRPFINFMVARFSSSSAEADEALAVLTATYPIGHLPYGWLNQIRSVSPAFQKKGALTTPVSSFKVAIFCVLCLAVSASVSVLLFWVPGVSVAIMTSVVGVPHSLAVASVNPLRIFGLFCYPVVTRASLTGWLTAHHQTKLLIPTGPLRFVSILSSLFVFPLLGITGATMGVAALFMGFVTEMVVTTIMSSAYVCWKRWNCKCWRVIRHSSVTTDKVKFSPLEEEDIDLDEEHIVPVTEARKTEPMEESMEETSAMEDETSL